MEPDSTHPRCSIAKKISDTSAACLALIKLGACIDDFEKSFSAVSELSADGVNYIIASGDDVIAILAWILGISPKVLGPFLRDKWRADELDYIRKRFLQVRDSHQLKAGASRRNGAHKTQPEEVRKQVNDILQSGQARNKTHAYEILGKAINKSPEYIAKRARTYAGDTSR